MKDWIKKWQSRDVLLHYTDFYKGIELITANEKLKFSKRNYSSDPIEKMNPLFSIGGVFNPESADELFETYKDESEAIKKDLQKIITENIQACFCQNQDFDQSRKHTLIQLETYGFTKQRMWAQYGDKYKGVCLVFSKSKLLENNELIGKSINYLPYEFLNSKSYRVDINKIIKHGAKVYSKTEKEKIIEGLFVKHLDYQNEQEYRLIKFSNSDSEFIDVKEAIEGIIVCNSYLNDENRDKVIKTAEEKNIRLINLGWSHGGVNIYDLQGNSLTRDFQTYMPD